MVTCKLKKNRLKKKMRTEKKTKKKVTKISDTFMTFTFNDILMTYIFYAIENIY